MASNISGQYLRDIDMAGTYSPSLPSSTGSPSPRQRIMPPLRFAAFA